MQVFLTKPEPMDLIIRGLDACKVWFFDKPIFYPYVIECPVFGEIDERDYKLWRWGGGHHVSGKILRKSPLVSEAVWSQIMDTFYHNNLRDISEHHEKANAEFYKSYKKIDHSAKQRIIDTDKRSQFISSKIEKPTLGCREWILPLNLSISLI